MADDEKLLQELRAQRASIQSHLAWIDEKIREIEKSGSEPSAKSVDETGGYSITFSSEAAETEALEETPEEAPRHLTKSEPPASKAIPTPSLSPVAQTSSASGERISASSDNIVLTAGGERFSTSRTNVLSDTKTGCILMAVIFVVVFFGIFFGISYYYYDSEPAKESVEEGIPSRLLRNKEKKPRSSTPYSKRIPLPHTQMRELEPETDNSKSSK